MIQTKIKLATYASRCMKMKYSCISEEMENKIRNLFDESLNIDWDGTNCSVGYFRTENDMVYKFIEEEVNEL